MCPPSGESQSVSRQKLWWRILDSVPKIKWMVLTILIPEYLLGRALDDWIAARPSVDTMPKWTRIEKYLANMGHFVLDVGDVDWNEAAGGQDGGRLMVVLVSKGPPQNQFSRFDIC